MPATKIIIEDLELYLSVGLHPEERKAPQRILISMDLRLRQDYMQNVTQENMVDYAEICEKLKEWETKPHIDLIETLAQKASDIALSYSAVTSARIHIRKPDIITETKSVGVEVIVEC